MTGRVCHAIQIAPVGVGNRALYEQRRNAAQQERLRLQRLEQGGDEDE